MLVADGHSGRVEVTRARVLRVMAARLAICLGALVLALTLVGAGRLENEAEVGLYGTLGAAFLATALHAAFLPWVRKLWRFAGLQLVGDLGLVTALVAFSGGGDSIFSFLYLPVVVFGALFFDKVGAYASAAGASAGLGVAIFFAARVSAGSLAPMPVELSFALWGVHSGALLLVALFAGGLTRDLRLAGQRLEASATDLATLRTLHERTVASLTSGVLTTDAEGRVTSFNPEAERITGQEVAMALGAPLAEVLPGIESVASRGTSPGRARARFRFVDVQGDERFLGVAMSDLRSAPDQPGGRVVIFQDVTEVVRMEAELARSARMAGIGELAASIAHEIRNPLAAISGSVELLRADLSSGEGSTKGGRLMEIVLREIDRLNHLITDFLQYARPTPPKFETVDLGGLAGQVAEAFGTSLDGGVELEVSLAPDCWVHGDARQLQQLLWNLLGNAQQACREGGRICLGVAVAALEPQGAGQESRNEAQGCARLVELTVSDDGVGIETGSLERIFDPFFTTRSEGTGLGLATVHRIAESHGGSIQVESHLGRGTRFCLRLPAEGGA